MKLRLHARRSWTPSVCGLAALAVAPLPAAAAPLTFECDVPAAHFSNVSQPATGPALSATGQLTVKELRRGDGYGPTAGIQFSSVDQKQLLVLRLVAPSQDKKALHGELIVRSGDKTQNFDLGKVDGSTSISFKLSASELGKADVQLGENRYVADFAALSSAKIVAFCSSGDFNFGDLTFAGP
jgi:hypothetical protein